MSKELSVSIVWPAGPHPRDAGRAHYCRRQATRSSRRSASTERPADFHANSSRAASDPAIAANLHLAMARAPGIHSPVPRKSKRANRSGGRHRRSVPASLPASLDVRTRADSRAAAG